MRGIAAGAAREIAAGWVAEDGVRTPGFVGAFLHGSINWLPDDAELPATSDLDVMLVLAGDAPAQKPGKFRYKGVLLEVSWLPSAAVASAERVLGNAHLAGSFHRASVLADPTGHLTTLQQDVARHYADEVWVLRRCADVEAKMRRPFPPPDALFPEQVNAWLFPTGLTTHLLLVAGLRNPTVRRRYEAVRDLLTEQGKMEVYAGLLEDLGVADMTPRRAVTHLDALKAAFLDAAQAVRSPFFFAADLSEDGYPVAIRGTRELIARGDHREAMFWLAATAVRCQQVFIQDAPGLLPRHKPGFRALLADLGVRDRDELIARRAAMLARLPERWQVAREIIAARRDTTVSMD
ncbi:MAG: hypothetical protein M3Z20_20275 [Chloroflexota bacterium]|nr:hypothetical protein [Chloroflexota bacterium]